LTTASKPTHLHHLAAQQLPTGEQALLNQQGALTACSQGAGGCQANYAHTNILDAGQCFTTSQAWLEKLATLTIRLRQSATTHTASTVATCKDTLLCQQTHSCVNRHTPVSTDTLLCQQTHSCVIGQDSSLPAFIHALIGEGRVWPSWWRHGSRSEWSAILLLHPWKPDDSSRLTRPDVLNSAIRAGFSGDSTQTDTSACLWIEILDNYNVNLTERSTIHTS